MLKRITPEQVKLAYERTKLRPQKLSTLSYECACGLGAIYLDGLGLTIANTRDVLQNHIDKQISVFSELDKEYHPEYTSGFIMGFDSTCATKEGFIVILGQLKHLSEIYKTGAEDGFDAQKVMFSVGEPPRDNN